MDLDDLLEDLVDGVRERARAEARRVRRDLGDRAGRRRDRLRRRARRAARAGGTLVALVFAALTAALALAGTPGGIRLTGAALAALVAAAGAATALAAHRAERRDPRSRSSRNRRRRTQRRSRRRGEPVEGPDPSTEELRGLPPDVRRDWERLLQARRLLQDLATDGWVDRSSLLEVDGQLVRLHRLLVADARTTALGGRAAPALRRQVGDLADLLVALADEAVDAQAVDDGAQQGVQATLTAAKDHLVALRAARAEVDRIDEQPRPAEG